MSKAPIVHRYAWHSLIFQAILAGLIVAALLAATGWSFDIALLVGIALYLAYSIGIRRVIAKSHWRGMNAVKSGRFQDAIPFFEDSYDFFSRHVWLDKGRHLLLGSSSAMSYREMALVNMAFCFAQTGHGRRSKEYYERALREFPGSVIAQTALRMADSFGETGSQQ
ncbi:MAG: hypothetical protein FJ020_02470 [Chloroflexi bacterium]|nr:hypothetical protein [Chloroflexota bacterium]